MLCYIAAEAKKKNVNHTVKFQNAFKSSGKYYLIKWNLFIAIVEIHYISAFLKSKQKDVGGI